jgi:hypothetical protein
VLITSALPSSEHRSEVQSNCGREFLGTRLRTARGGQIPDARYKRHVTKCRLGPGRQAGRAAVAPPTAVDDPAGLSPRASDVVAVAVGLDEKLEASAIVPRPLYPRAASFTSSSRCWP